MFSLLCISATRSEVRSDNDNSPFVHKRSTDIALLLAKKTKKYHIVHSRVVKADDDRNN